MELRGAQRYVEPIRSRSEIVVGVIAGDHAELRRLAAALSAPPFEIALLTNDLREFVVEASTADVDVVVYYAPGSVRELLEVTPMLRKRLQDESRLVGIVPSAKSRDLKRVLDAGLDGLVLASQVPLSLAVTVRSVWAGQLAVPREARAYVQDAVLSYRERQVLAGVAEGLTNREIAARMLVSTSTVKSHLSTAFTKLDVRTRDEAAAVLLETGQAPQPLLRA